jgi:predicted metal-dependent phosphoesterase TrpH
MNADLHCHSTVSDGLLSPADVAARAHAGGVTLWSLTDHDQLGGQREAREAAEALGMDYLAGVEISVTWAGRTVHIVGLNVDPENQILLDGVAATRNGRRARGEAIGEALAAIGIPGAFEGALRYAEDPNKI